MNRSRLIYSGLISLLILAGYQSGHAQDKVTCKAMVIFHGQELSGRMMFKQVTPDTVRFAFFNELGMSFVEGSVNPTDLQISKIAPFLDYKSFVKNLERGFEELLVDKNTGSFILPAKSPDRSVEMIYQKGNKFILKLFL
jgi:hypothetical protein